jgi:CheY-like chemotaxis protein
MTPWSILVVEDDELLGLLLSELLVEMGHRVCAIAIDESAAVAAAAVHRPDLMIVDAGLGQGCGLRAVQTVQATGSVRHIFTTGDADSVRRSRPEAIVLEKPFNEPQLARAISLAMS